MNSRKTKHIPATSRQAKLVILVTVALAATLAGADQKLRELKPGFNLFSVQQDIQMGKEYASQVERQMQVVNNSTINNFVQGIGRNLMRGPEAQAFPFTFKVVNEKSINAFALPGGPTFTHTGLILAADNEAQIAGVLAHEMSHVILRHGTNQASKQQLLQLPAMLAGGVLGGKGGLTGALAQIGIGLGANSVLLKFSRNAERDADLMGARIMNEAGYNPIEMARFFEKLEAESGKGSWITNFLSDHPNPGNRVKAVEDEIRLLPRRQYTADAGNIDTVKRAVQGLPAAPARTPGQQASAGSAQAGAGNPNDIASARPSNRLREFQGGEVVFSYPDNWEVFPDQQTREITIASRAGIVNQAIGYGMVANMVNSSNRGDLFASTDQLIRDFQQRDPNLKVAARGRQFRIGNANALATRLQGQSPFQGAVEQDVLLTIERPQGIFYILFIAPDRDLSYAQPIFDQIINSIRFAN